MGVQGLWDLLLPTARKIDLSQLKGHILAIDASLWIVKVASIFSDKQTMLQTILKKIILLMRNQIRPVFVFDGIAPILKRNTLEKRRRQRLEFSDSVIKKRAQLEVLKVVTGAKSDNNSKQKRQSQISQGSVSSGPKLVEIKEQLNEIDMVKLEMQSELLNSEYELMVETSQHIKFQYNLQEFSRQPIDSRLEIIKYYKNHHFPKQKQMQQELSNKELIERQIIRINKKTKVTELQHNMYIKLMNKVNESTQQGYEVVEGQIDKKKFTQKRKIHQVNKFDEIFEQAKKLNKNHNKEWLNQQEQQEMKKQQIEEENFFGFLKNVTDIDEFIKSSVIVDGKTLKQHEEDSWSALFQSQKQSQEPVEINVKSMVIDSNQHQKTYQKKCSLESSQQKQQFPPHYEIYDAPQLQLNQTNIELKQLLQVLGLPYINAPSEAQAQCAYLEMNELVDGIVTEDSDVFLFGGENVYRGVFQNEVKYYSMEKIKQQVKIDRIKAILFALFLGSDYTEGIRGIGIVNAMEIIKVFDTVERMEMFRKWAILPDQLSNDIDSFYDEAKEREIQFYKFHKNFKKYWYLDETFPDKNVINEYLNPKVDESKQQFKFADPNLVLVEKIFRQQLNLKQNQIKQYLHVLSNSKYKGSIKLGQQKITDFLNSNPLAIIKSKRLQKALKQE